MKVENRNDVDLSVVVENEEGKNGLAFVVHGLGGFKEQTHIRSMAQAFLDEGYTVVTYDAANTIGESGGRMEDATLTNYFEDLEDVVEWAKSQPWYKKPFIVSGHSLGGACSVMLAAKYPELVKAIAPVCPFVSGDLYESHSDPMLIKEWQSKGFIMQPSQSKPNVMKKLGWTLAEDLRQQDVRKSAANVICPALIVAGSKDAELPPKDVKQLVDCMKGPTVFHIIKGMAHNPRSDVHNTELRETIEYWLTSLDTQK